MKRTEGRGAGALRPVRIARNYLKHAEGYVLIEMVDTKVICSASVEENVPPFLRNSGKGWITAEYFMLPRSTHTRTSRDSVTSCSNGRALEIQRLIGRSLRSVVDLEGFGERTIWVDCDGIQADGGTRTASITGASVALVDAFRKMVKDEVIDRIPIEDYEAAVSVGKASGNVLLDLNYEEDSSHLKASDKHFCWMAVNTPWTAPVYETAFRKNTLKASQFHLTLSLTLDIL